MVNFHRLREPLALFSASRWFAACPAREGRPTTQASLRLVVTEVSVDLFFPCVVVGHRGYSGSGRRRAFRVEAAPRTRSQRFLEPNSRSDRRRRRGRAGSRLSAEPGALGKLGAAVNKLLEDLEQRGAQLQDREQLFQRLVETVHDAVLVHRKRDSVCQFALSVAARAELRRCRRPAADRFRGAGICRAGGKQFAAAAGGRIRR